MMSFFQKLVSQALITEQTIQPCDHERERDWMQFNIPSHLQLYAALFFSVTP